MIRHAFRFFRLIRLRPYAALRPAQQPEGFALITVIVMLTVMASIGASLSLRNRMSLRSVLNAQASVSKQLQDEAGLNLGLLILISDRKDNPILLDGTSFDVAWNRLVYRLRIQNENGKIAINRDQNALFEVLLKASCVPPGEARALARSQATLLSASKDASGQISKSHDVFETLGSLRRVPGLTYAIWDRISQDITVYGKGALPDIRFASAKVKRLTASLSSQVAGPQSTTDFGKLFGPRPQFRSENLGRGTPGAGIYSIAVSAASDGVPSLQAIVATISSKQAAFKVLEWRRRVPSGGDTCGEERGG